MLWFDIMFYRKGNVNMIKDKIKALITITGHSQAELADKKKVSRQQFNLKITRNAFRINDLIELAELTNTTLAFNDKETGKALIEFDKNDIKQDDQ
jgi:transcriptional regulator with XRE-family HTH domain